MRTVLGGIPLVGLALGVACSRPASETVKRPATVPAAIVESSGGKQISTAGSPLDQPLVVQVNDASGAPVAGASVWFRSAGNAAFLPAYGITGADGQFTTAVTLPSMAGRYQITAATKGAEGKTIEMKVEERALGFEENLGRQLSDRYCARCHDPESTPERVSNSDNLTAKPHAFSDGAFLNKMTNADLSAIIGHGGPGLGKSAEMPPYGAVLNRAGINSLIAYIRAVSDPPYQPPREVVYGQK